MELGVVLDEQLKKLEDDADLTSGMDFWVAQKWESRNTILGLSAVMLSGAVAALGALASVEQWQIFKSEFIVFSTILSSIATVLSSVLTFLKPSERASNYREYGNKQKALRNRIRLFRTVSRHIEGIKPDAHEQLLLFSTEKDTLNSDNPPLSRAAYEKVKADLEAKRKRAEP